MTFSLSDAGRLNPELARKVNQWWLNAAGNAQVDLEGFDPDAPLHERTACALERDLVIGAIYARFSSKQQHSTEDQIRECVIWAARNGILVPPELISVDEAVTGRQLRRDGLERMKQILRGRYASVLLVFKASRLFRQAFKGYQLIQEEVVEEGLRAVSVSQGIDTADKKSWKIQLQTHGLLDDLLLDAIADHVRAGLTGLFLKGWTTGALGVGYRPKELPHAPLTNRGLPRTIPEVDPAAADLIQQHARWLLEGMNITEGLRRWRKAGGPCDPRSTTGQMSYGPYRRLFENERLTGRWEFGRKRNQFSTKLDSVKQIEQPNSEVSFYQCEELRILDDETFLALRKLLRGRKTGPRGPRQTKQAQLWDLTTEFFLCAHCSQSDAPVRFYQAGAKGQSMRCKNGDFCPCTSAVRREDAVRAICEKLTELIARDRELIEEVVCRSCEWDAQGDDDLRRRVTTAENTVRTLTRRIDDLYELSGQGSDADRREVLAKIRAVQSERTAAQVEVTRLNKVLDGTAATLSAEDVRSLLADFTTLLERGAAGELGEDAIYKALSVFRNLTGGRIFVHVEQRPGRKRTNVRGVFQPQLLQTVQSQGSPNASAPTPSAPEVSVWLRQPPRLDAIAERVHQLIDVDGQSYRAAAATLQAEGHNVNSGNVWYSYRRWYEMQGQPVPDQDYNNGQPRKPRSP